MNSNEIFFFLIRLKLSFNSESILISYRYHHNPTSGLNYRENNNDTICE